MKSKNFIYVFFALIVACVFVSCDKKEPQIHTDASLQFSTAITYVGSMVNADGAVVAEDANVLVERIPFDSLQAVHMHITVPSIAMDQEANFNVCAAGQDRYFFSTGSSSSTTGEAIQNCSCVLNGDVLTMYLSLNSKYKFSTATAAKIYTFTCKKQ